MIAIPTAYRPWELKVDPKRCSTGDPDKGGNCTSCVEYRRLRNENRAQRGLQPIT